MLNPKDIESVIDGCREGRLQDRRRLYDLYVNQLYRVVYRILNDHHDTQDVLQISFLKIFEKINKYKNDRGSIFNWMCRICINEGISHIRRRKRPFFDLNENYSIQSQDVSILDELSVDYIHDAIEKIPDAFRVIFTLYEIEGYSHKEISKLLEIEEPTSRSYLSRARKKLQILISDELKKQTKYEER